MLYHEETHAQLAARHYLYELFQSLFGNEPAAPLLEAVDRDVVADALSIVLPQGSVETEIQRILQVFEAPAEYLPSMERDYTQAFVGPHDLPAPPWESVYVSSKRLLFQISTLQIRDIYRSQGFIPKEYPHVADDHVALELDFLAQLAQRALHSYAASLGDEFVDGSEMVEVNIDDAAEGVGIFVEAIDVSHSFVSEHLAKWVDALAQRFVVWRSDSFYADAALVLASFVHADEGLLSQLEQATDSL